MTEVDILTLEAAINRCRHAVRSAGVSARRDLADLAGLYGLMIFNRRVSFDLDAQDAVVQTAFKNWQADAHPSGSGS
jgi:hypothetical protein